MNAQSRIVLAERLRGIREDIYGKHGGHFLADDLEIPLQSWLNYEEGVVVPAHVVLELIFRAAVNTPWLLTADGAKFERLTMNAARGADVA